MMLIGTISAQHAVNSVVKIGSGSAQIVHLYDAPKGELAAYSMPWMRQFASNLGCAVVFLTTGTESPVEKTESGWIHQETGLRAVRHGDVFKLYGSGV